MFLNVNLCTAVHYLPTLNQIHREIARQGARALRFLHQYIFRKRYLQLFYREGVRTLITYPGGKPR